MAFWPPAHLQLLSACSLLGGFLHRSLSDSQGGTVGGPITPAYTPVAVHIIDSAALTTEQSIGLAN